MFRTPVLPALLVALLLAGGCGSKISQANYYRVQLGMTEQEVDEVLGPAHTEDVPPAAASRPAASQPVNKVKTWTRGDLTIRVEFRDGIVVGRTASGESAFKR